jgi:hypothetical protein
MPRRQKPPGKEKWTWDEINQGRKFSKTERRYRALAQSLGANKSSTGKTIPPSAADNPSYYVVFIGLLIAFVAVAILSALNSK